MLRYSGMLFPPRSDPAELANTVLFRRKDFVIETTMSAQRQLQLLRPSSTLWYISCRPSSQRLSEYCGTV